MNIDDAANIVSLDTDNFQHNTISGAGNFRDADLGGIGDVEEQLEQVIRAEYEQLIASSPQNVAAELTSVDEAQDMGRFGILMEELTKFTSNFCPWTPRSAALRAANSLPAGVLRTLRK